ncbi:MAG: hypothetical protein U0934_11890 [Pseudotabrizicola sp.]|uniref:hypothetical protein n=1 Tax=Pseudotabrizicola sp. TaxID=2939647 RepID=UPI00271A04EE|nr:hypothetical protein [Pseudotabrizicola sp.]MDO8882048.1 hypothetical protein [Pseudotabrizicola sp.]MDP2080776.1 hypothetical protein [Pseudotabrizicola sp.]MDZ7574638.1 hypothetical protein [Pseudotabrizicola sp.]
MVDPFALPLLDPTPQLTLLRAALTRLAGSTLPATARMALAEAQMALSALETVMLNGSAAIDRSVFDSLLAMAGPDIAPELVAQMAADLRAVSIALARGLALPDLEAIKAQTHVLVALAGSAGARGLEQGAQRVNLAAHHGDTAQINEMGPGLLAGLGTLIAFVEATQITPGGKK